MDIRRHHHLIASFLDDSGGRLQPSQPNQHQPYDISFHHRQTKQPISKWQYQSNSLLRHASHSASQSRQVHQPARHHRQSQRSHMLYVQVLRYARMSKTRPPSQATMTTKECLTTNKRELSQQPSMPPTRPPTGATTSPTHPNAEDSTNAHLHHITPPPLHLQLDRLSNHQKHPPHILLIQPHALRPLRAHNSPP